VLDVESVEDLRETDRQLVEPIGRSIDDQRPVPEFDPAHARMPVAASISRRLCGVAVEIPSRLG
jgi:hypothetical protein